MLEHFVTQIINCKDAGIEVNIMRSQIEMRQVFLNQPLHILIDLFVRHFSYTTSINSDSIASRSASITGLLRCGALASSHAGLT